MAFGWFDKVDSDRPKWVSYPLPGKKHHHHHHQPPQKQTNKQKTKTKASPSKPTTTKTKPKQNKKASKQTKTSSITHLHSGSAGVSQVCSFGWLKKAENAVDLYYLLSSGCTNYLPARCVDIYGSCVFVRGAEEGGNSNSDLHSLRRQHQVLTCRPKLYRQMSFSCAHSVGL